MSLMNINGLKVYYSTRSGHVKAVDDVSLDIHKGDTLGIVGESGCGKSTLALSIMRLLPPNARIMGGEIIFEGVNIFDIPIEKFRKIRLKKISMIFQGAMNALNPVFRVKDILREALQTHEDIGDSEAMQRIKDMLRLVILKPEIAEYYPHELSGGMKQRVIIALSLLCNPQLVLADEPTTALDVVTQDQILMRIKEIQRKLELSMILISHDVSIVAETCTKTAVMYAGHIVEYGDTLSLFEDSRNPYTNGLLRSFPSIKGKLRKLRGIPGEPPNLLNLPTGCVFSPRCPVSTEICRTNSPPKIEISSDHWSFCHYAEDPIIVRENPYKLD